MSSSEENPAPDKVESDGEEEDFIGPVPAGPVRDEEGDKEPPKKKMKVLDHESIYLDNMPDAQYYEKSFMHRDTISHIVVTPTDFIITTSVDGHLKFWKKQELGIEFVKHYRAHLGNVQAICSNVQGTLLCTVSNDKSYKVFDVVNFDMINMMKLEYEPLTCEWIHKSGDAIEALAISNSSTPSIYIYNGLTNELLTSLENIHQSVVNIIKYNPIYDLVISSDTKGMIEYWTGVKHEYQFPKNVKFSTKLDTDLYEFVTKKSSLLNMSMSPNGVYFAGLSSDRKIYIFKTVTAKITRIYDENIQSVLEMQSKTSVIPQMEFGRRMALEREMDKLNLLKSTNIIFDDSSNFILYPTVIGIKIINIITNKLIRIIGKLENLRFMQISMFQGRVRQNAAPTIELEVAENPALENTMTDPTIFCNAMKKNRFYLFTRRDDKSSIEDRDVFNEKPSKEDIISSTEVASGQKVYDSATLHTTKGDVTIKIFKNECPRTAENFCVHSKNGYYNGHIFHRIIKGFMIQTGDPTGIGTGGESIWGGEFEDEFNHSLKHDRPYTVSMANAGPNSNGSQFFITITPTPWLDNKHTVFGRVIRGMEIVQSISMVKTNPKTDKPYDDVSIINITLR